jgi:hypothetical protein
MQAANRSNFLIVWILKDGFQKKDDFFIQVNFPGKTEYLS